MTWTARLRGTAVPGLVLLVCLIWLLGCGDDSPATEPDSDSNNTNPNSTPPKDIIDNNESLLNNLPFGDENNLSDYQPDPANNDTSNDTDNPDNLKAELTNTVIVQEGLPWDVQDLTLLKGQGGEFYLAVRYVDWSGSPIQWSVQLFKGTSGSWTPLKQAYEGYERLDALATTLGQDGLPIVAFVESDSPRITVRQWDGSNWMTIREVEGADLPVESVLQVHALELSTDDTGELYLATLYAHAQDLPSRVATLEKLGGNGNWTLEQTIENSDASGVFVHTDDTEAIAFGLWTHGGITYSWKNASGWQEVVSEEFSISGASGRLESVRMVRGADAVDYVSVAYSHEGTFSGTTRSYYQRALVFEEGEMTHLYRAEDTLSVRSRHPSVVVRADGLPVVVGADTREDSLNVQRYNPYPEQCGTEKVRPEGDGCFGAYAYTAFPLRKLDDELQLITTSSVLSQDEMVHSAWIETTRAGADGPRTSTIYFSEVELLD